MVICSAFACKSRSERKEEGVTFHRFPVKDPKRTKQWIKNMNIDNWEPSKDSRLCSKHFHKHFLYKIGNRTCLIDDAIPTIFGNSSKLTQLQEEVKSEIKREIPTVPDEIISSNSRLPPVSPTTVIKVEYVDTPKSKRLQRKLVMERLKSKEKSRKIKVLGQKVKRCKQTIMSLKQIIKNLQPQNMLSPDECLIIEVCPDSPEN